MREPLVHVYDGPNPRNVDLAGVLRAAVRGSADTPATASGVSMSGLVQAVVPLRVRMAPGLWLGLAAYELTVPGHRVEPIRQFLTLRQTTDHAPVQNKDEAVFAPHAVHVYDKGPQPVWVDLNAVWRGLVGPSGPQRPAPVGGMSMDGLVAGEVSVAARMAPGLWLGLTSYTLEIFGLRTISVQHFVSSAHVRKREPGEDVPPF